MKFRTEIKIQPSIRKIDYGDKLVFLGSCFSEEIGSQLVVRGFDALVNPLGPLFNPLAIENCLSRALNGPLYGEGDLTPGPRGLHCLDYASRFSGSDSDAITEALNTALIKIKNQIEQGAYVFLTFGTTMVYYRADNGCPVGNCHKFPSSFFCRRRLPIKECEASLARICGLLKENGAKGVVYTVSPVRHVADGLHGNTLNKATLQLAIEEDILKENGFAEYFPSFEILNDDLRDYRFYGKDMVHPSESAVEYIYSKFEETYFSPATVLSAEKGLKEFKRSQHRQILE